MVQSGGDGVSRSLPDPTCTVCLPTPGLAVESIAEHRRWNSRCPFQHRQTRLVMNVPAHTRLLIASSYKQMTAGHHVKELNPNGPEQMIQRPVTTGWMVMVPSVAGDVNRHFTHHFPCNSALTLLLIGLVALNLSRYEVARGERGRGSLCLLMCL